MIMFYFSATGNSKYIAELFCRNMGAMCRSIEEDTDFYNIIASEDTIGFCYPVYGSRVPRLMREFARKYVDMLKHKRLIIFCTQMCFSGDGARAFTDVFPHGFAEVIYAEHFLMPNNICNLFLVPLPSKNRIHKYLGNAQRKIETVCRDISNGVIRKRGFNPGSRLLGLIQGVFLPGIEERARDRVWIDDDCNQCGLCISMCPMNNFSVDSSKVITKNNCMMCYRCINKCPQKAIAVFLRGKVKDQYIGV